MTARFPIAAATATLADRLHRLIGDAVTGAQVTTLNPGLEKLRTGDPFVNLYLFRAVRNGALSNLDLPTRSATGYAMSVPTLVLTLDYMITFFGDDTRLDPQRLLGLVAAGLSAWPVLDPADVAATIAATPWLGDAETPMAPMRLSPMNLTPEQMARVWSEFVNVPYQLTQLYTLMSVVLPEPVAVSPVLPVRQIGLRAAPRRPLAITAIVNAGDPALPLASGAKMAVGMLNPAQPDLAVELDGTAARDVAVGFDADGAAALIVTLDQRQAGLTCGPLTVRVVRGGADPAATTPVACVVAPALAGTPTIDPGRMLRVPLALPVRAGAVACILLYPFGASTLSGVRLDCATAPAGASVLSAPLGATAAGRYLVGVEVDGVASMLDYDGDRFTGPLLDIPKPAP